MIKTGSDTIILSLYRFSYSHGFYYVKKKQEWLHFELFLEDKITNLLGVLTKYNKTLEKRESKESINFPIRHRL